MRSEPVCKRKRARTSGHGLGVGSPITRTVNQGSALRPACACPTPSQPQQDRRHAFNQPQMRNRPASLLVNAYLEPPGGIEPPDTILTMDWSLTAVPTCDDPGWEPPQVRQLWDQFRRPCDDPPGGSHPEAGGVPWGCQAQMGIVVVPCAAAGSWTFALDSRASVPCLHPQYPGQSRWPVGGGRSPPRHPLLPRDQRSQWDRDPLRRPEKDPRNFDACPADRVGGECLRHWAAPPAPTDASSPSPEAALNASRQPQTQPA